MISLQDCEKTSWKDFGTDYIDFHELLCMHDISWRKLIDRLVRNDRIKEMEKILTETFPKTTIYPHPMLVFRCFWMPLDKIKIVILGQDPYIGSENNIPQATGLSFSVPKGFKIPPSLMNIFKNLKKYGHLREIPKSGDLSPLIEQGVFLLNTSLTVVEGKSNSHARIWRWFTDEVIRYINRKRPNVIFVLWGRNAILKKEFLNPHTKTIMSSHPSPLGADKFCGPYNPFNETDFGKYLDIDWNVLLE